jgi:hypothetical protein
MAIERPVRLALDEIGLHSNGEQRRAPDHIEPGSTKFQLAPAFLLDALRDALGPWMRTLPGVRWPRNSNSYHQTLPR